MLVSKNSLYYSNADSNLTVMLAVRSSRGEKEENNFITSQKLRPCGKERWLRQGPLVFRSVRAEPSIPEGRGWIREVGRGERGVTGVEDVLCVSPNLRALGTVSCTLLPDVVEL